MGLMQHHDAVTGTEKQNVAEDYSKRLYKAVQECQSNNLEKLFPNIDPATIDRSQTNCPLLNISQCIITESNDKFIVSVYNPLSRSQNPFLRIPVPDPGYSVYNDQAERVTVQVNELPTFIKNIPGRESLSEYELIFRAFDVPALGYRQFFVQKEDFKWDQKISQVTELGTTEDYVFETDGVEIDLLYYNGLSGSGAYIFRPDSSGKHKIGDVTYREIRGDLVNETIMETGNWGAVTIRNYLEIEETEISWQVGPIPGGKEVVVAYSSGLDTEELFYTDANGRQMVERKRSLYNNFDNKRSLEPESSNYYPVTSRIELRGSENLTIITDRSQGGSSLEDGQLELMVHRRCLFDDGFGVGEALMEEAFGEGLVARGQHYLLKGAPLSQSRILNQEKVLTPQLSFIGTSLSVDDWVNSGMTTYSALLKELPVSAQLLTLSMKDDKVLLRFQHIFDKQEDNEPVVVDIQNLFTEFDVKTLEEMTLAGNQAKNSIHGFEFTLDPLEIRTFIVTISWK